MKASLLTAVLLLALAAAPTEAMERANSLSSLPAAGGRPMPRQGTVAQFKKEGGVPGRVQFFEQLGKGSGQAAIVSNPDRAAHVRQILARYKQKGPVTDQEVTNFENQVHQRHQQLKGEAMAAANSSGKPFLPQYAKLVRRQTQAALNNIQSQQGKMTVADHVEVQALAAAASEVMNQNAAQNGGPDLSDTIAVLEAAADQKGGLGFADFGFSSLDFNQQLANNPIVKEFREKESHERQRFERIPAAPGREAREREAHEKQAREMKAFFEDQAVLAVLTQAVLGAELLEAINIATVVSNVLHKSGSHSSGGSPRGSRKLERSEGSATNIHEASSGSSQRGSTSVLSLDLNSNSHLSFGQPSNIPRGSLTRQGSGSNLLQGKCYNEDPMTLRASIAQDHVPLKFYGRSKFTTQEIAEMQARSAMTNKASLAQGSLYTFAFGVFSWRSSTLHNGMMAKFWQWSSSVDSTITSGGKSILRSMGGAARRAIPFRANMQKDVSEEYATRVASVLYYMCIPQACRQDAIYGFYNTLVRGLHGDEAQFAELLMKKQKKIDERNAKKQGKAGYEARDNVLFNPCPHQPNQEDFNE